MSCVKHQNVPFNKLRVSTFATLSSLCSRSKPSARRQEEVKNRPGQRGRNETISFYRLLGCIENPRESIGKLQELISVFKQGLQIEGQLNKNSLYLYNLPVTVEN